MATTTSLILYRGAGTVPGGYFYRNLPRYGLINPSGYQPVDTRWTPPVTNLGGMESALGGERRRKLSKALHEALESPERQQAPKKPRKHPPARATEAPQAAPEPERRVFGVIPPEPAPLPPLRIAGNARIRGARVKWGCASVRPSGTARADVTAIPGARYKARTGMLTPLAVQNLTDEQLFDLLHAA